MTLTLELTPEQERHLEQEASRRHMDAASYALSLLTMPELAEKSSSVETEEELPLPGSLTPAEIVAYWEREGILRPRPDLPDSPIYARQLREEAQKRVRE